MSRPSARIAFILPLLTLLSSCMGEGKRMLGELERLEALNQSDTLFTSDSAAQRLVTYYDRWYRIPTNRNRKLRMRAYYMLGSAYRDMGESPKALESFQLAVEAGDTTSSNYDVDYLMRIHSQMSELYLKQRLLDEELKELDIAEHLAWKIKDTLSALIFCEYRCHSLYNKGEYEKCIKQTTELSRRFHESGYSDEALLTYTYCINSCFALGRYSQMKEYITKYEECNFIRKAPQKIAGGRSALYIFKGQYYQATERADSAIYYFRKALTHIQEGTSELLVYKGLFQAYGLQHNADSVLKYTSLYAEAKDRNFDNEVAEATIHTKELYDYTEEQKIVKKKTSEIYRLRGGLYICLLIVVICVGLTLFLMFLHEKRERKFRELQQEHQRATNTMLDLEEELKFLKAEKVYDTTTVNSCMQKIDVLKERITYLEHAMLNGGGKNNRAKLEECDIVKRFRDACIPRPKGNNQIQEEDWNRLRDAVEKHYPHFYDLMNQRRQLSVKDYRVCLLTMANFCAFDIDLLMEQQPSYASVAKKRLHKKVFGYDGAAAEFDKKLHHL